jgi:hypothetical protein
VQHELWLVGVAAAQQRCQVAIDFDHVEPSGGVQQSLRERPPAGPYLDRGVARFQTDDGDDAGNDCRVVQEMLAETLAGSPLPDAQSGS